MLKGAVLIVLVLLAGCTTTPEAPPLRIGTSVGAPPLVFADDTGLRGVEVDLAAEVAALTGRRLQWQTYNFDELLPALQRGDVDVAMAGISVTPARARSVRFVTPYLDAGLMAVMRREDLGRLNSAGAARQPGIRVGVERGTTAVDYVSGHFPAATVTEYASQDEVVAALLAARLDYAVLDAPAVWYLTGRPEGRDLVAWFRFLNREQLAWAVAPGDALLAQTLSEALAQLRADGRLGAILNRWMPVRTELE